MIQGRREVAKGKGDQIYGDKKRFDLGWWTHNTIYRWYIRELYTWNLYHFVNQCHPINLIKNNYSNEFYLFLFYFLFFYIMAAI